MKRKLPLIVTAVVSSLAVVLVAALSVLLPVRASAAAESKSKIVSVDYILALMDAGIGQKEIVQRIEEKNLAFRLAPGDIDRLREAGAGKHLIEVVIGEASPDATTGPQDQGGADASRWARPSRLGVEQKGKPAGDAPQPEASPAPSASSPTDDEAEYNGQGIDEVPYGGYSAYPGYDYWSGYYGFVYSYGYPYPYYYYPRYYYPYRSYYFSAPYYTYPHHSFRTVPRGGGSWRGVPHGGGGGRPRSTPRGGGSPRSSPRGSHHH